MSGNSRDKLLILLLPTLLVVAGYGWFIFRPMQTRLTSAVIALEAARDKAPQVRSELYEARAKMALAEYEVQRLQTEKTNYHKAWDRVAGCCANAKERNERIEKLNQMLARRRLRLVDDSEAESGNDSKICPSLERLAQHFTLLSNQGKPQLRRIHVVGRYLDVLGVLEDLAKGEVIAIPVGLRLKEAPVKYVSREWVLLVWI